MASTYVLQESSMSLGPVAAADGWFISPDGDFCYRFHHDPKSWKRYPFVFVDKWSANGGTPSQMKSRRKLPLDDALELCRHMLLDGWKKIEDQFENLLSSEFIEDVAV